MDELARIAEGLARIENPRGLLEGLFAHAPVGFQIYNAAGQSLLVNQAFLQLFGSAPPPEYSILKDEIAERNGLSSLIRRAFAGETIQLPAIWYDPRELKHVEVHEGRRVAIEISIFPLRDASGSVPFVALFHKDVTERETLGEALRQSQKLEAVGRLAGGVAHDFNNLLTIMQGYLEVLQDVDEPRRSTVREIARAADRAARLTQQLLAFSRRQLLQPRVVDLNAEVAELGISLLRLIGEHIELKTLLAPDLGHILVDPGQLGQVLLNLSVNAADAMPQGGRLLIETKNVDLRPEDAPRHPDLKPGAYVLLAVTDTGAGMDESTKRRIFEPFFTTKELGRGTGLGLATVYGIVNQSGGAIEVSSEPGSGSCFRLYFPRTDAPIEKPAPAPSAPRGGRETILVVEDEEPLRQLVSLVLRKAGYTVIEAADGEKALAAARAHRGPLHLLVTDVIMPGMSGRDLADEMSALLPETKILFVSGYTDDALVPQGRLDPGKEFLAKPFTPPVLIHKVRQVLDAARP